MNNNQEAEGWHEFDLCQDETGRITRFSAPQPVLGESLHLNCDVIELPHAAHMRVLVDETYDGGCTWKSRACDTATSLGHRTLAVENLRGSHWRVRAELTTPWSLTGWKFKLRAKFSHR